MVFSLVCLGWVVCGVVGLYRVVVCLIVLDCLWVLLCLSCVFMY